ncbi:MAG: type II toxin-antitoxin system HicB family antitoxin [Anaerolineae bacterium]|nr:type II toxin-antitoxin system HicB family antitoxin [Anaerolineae bacterium]
MTVDVLVRRETRGRYRATVLGWPECTVVAPNREEAIERTRQCLIDLLAASEIVQLDVDVLQASSAPDTFAGMWADDETFDEFLGMIEANRRQVDADEAQP